MSASSNPSVLTVMTVNVQYGGRQKADGSPDDRWPGLVRLIDTHQPDILLAQELTDFGDKPWLMFSAEHELGMRCLLAPAPYKAHTATFYRTDRLRALHWETKYADRTHHGFGIARLVHRAAPQPIAVCSAHLTPSSVTAAAVEAQTVLTRLLRDDSLAVLGGDINAPPLGDPEPDWAALPPSNVASRTTRRADGTLTADLAVADVLRRADMIDVAGYLADQRDHAELRTPTGKGRLRVDQLHITPALLPALADCQVIRTGTLSDHDAIVMTLDLVKLGGQGQDKARRTRVSP